jgi:hypothetical protein
MFYTIPTLDGETGLARLDGSESIWILFYKMYLRSIPSDFESARMQMDMVLADVVSVVIL